MFIYKERIDFIRKNREIYYEIKFYCLVIFDKMD